MHNDNPQVFLFYDKLEIGPHKIHKSKEKQKHAIFELCKDIASLLQENNYLSFQSISNNLGRLCKRFRKQYYY